jgi:hypothetical protein
MADPAPRKSWVVECTAECEDCGWSASGHWRTALLQAGTHAKKTGHQVRGYQTTVTLWNGNGKGDA